MVNCAVCGEDIQPRTVCPRCDTQDQGPNNLILGYFGSIWAVLSFVLILAPLFMLMSPIKEAMQEAFRSVASVRVAAPIALLLTMVFAFFLFSMRDDLHEQHQSRTFREKQRTPLPMRALQFFIAGVVLIFLLGFVVTSKGQLIGSGPGQIAEGSFPHLLLVFVMTGCLVLMFAFLSLATGYMAVYDFCLYAEGRTPDPIYLSEDLMLKVILKTVRAQLDPGVEVSLSKMRRTPDAGMELQLHQRGVLKTVGDDTLLEEKGWLIIADLWARLRTMVEHGTRTIKVETPKKEEPGSELVPAGKPAS